MANFKVVFVYSQPQNRGWTETYYRTAADLASAAIIPGALFLALARPRHPLTSIVKVRVSDVANNRNSLVRTLNLAVSGTPLATDPGPEINSTSAVLNLVSTAPASTRRLWLRGLYDSDVRRNGSNGVDAPSPGLRADMTGLIAELAADGFTIRSLVRTGTAPNIYQQISQVSGATGAGLTVISYIGTSAPAVNDRVNLSQLSPKLFPGLNGTYTVLAVGSQTFTIRYNLDYTPPSVVPLGRWRPSSFNYGPIVPGLSSFLKFGSRDTGAGFSSGRGRKRSVRLRSL